MYVYIDSIDRYNRSCDDYRNKNACIFTISTSMST